MMDFGEVLVSSWKVFWKNKVLWLFGLVPPLASVVVAMTGMLIVFNDRFLNGIFNINSFDSGITTGVIVFFLLFFIFWIVYLFVSFYADAAIVKGALVFDQTGEKLSVGRLLEETRPFYWRVTGLMLLFSAAVGIEVLFIWLFMFLITAVTLGMGAICVMPLMFLILPVNMLAMALIEMAKASLINANLKVGESVRRGWSLFKGNFWSVVLLLLIQFVIQSVITSILYIPLYVVFFIPMLAMMNSGTLNSPDFPIRMIETSKWVYVIAMPILVLGQSLIQTYFRSLWAVATLRLAKRSGPAPMPVESPVQLGII
jgi:hypothetical protein